MQQSRPGRAAGRPPWKPGRRWNAGVAWALAAALQLAGATATASVLVYLNELADGSTIPTPFEPIEILTNSTPTLELYIVDGAGASSAPGPSEAICVTTTLSGGETCGFELKILAEQDLVFTDFFPVDLVDDEIKFRKLIRGGEGEEDDIDVFALEADFDELRVNGTNTKGPWSPVPLHIGSLHVRSGSEQGRASVDSGLHVDASGGVAEVSAMQIIKVPEASQLAMLLAGVVLLGLLHHLRQRGASARECS